MTCSNDPEEPLLELGQWPWAGRRVPSGPKRPAGWEQGAQEGGLLGGTSSSQRDKRGPDMQRHLEEPVSCDPVSGLLEAPRRDLMSPIP